MDVRTAQRLRVEGSLGSKSRIVVAFVDSKLWVEYVLVEQHFQRIIDILIRLLERQYHAC